MHLRSTNLCKEERCIGRNWAEYWYDHAIDISCMYLLLSTDRHAREHHEEPVHCKQKVFQYHV